MKKTTAIIIALIFALTLVGCEDYIVDEPVTTTTQTTTAEKEDKDPVDKTVEENTIPLETVESTVTYISYIEMTELSELAANADVEYFGASGHLPTFKIDTPEDFETFKNTYKDVIAFDDSAHYNGKSFNEATAKYNSAFFEENTLMIVVFESGSSSFTYGLHSVYYDGSMLNIRVVKTNNPEVVTDDMIGCIVTLTLPDSTFENSPSIDSKIVKP